MTKSFKKFAAPRLLSTRFKTNRNMELVEEIRANLNKQRTTKKKRNIYADPVVYLKQMDKFLEKLEDYREDMSPKKLEQSDKIATFIMAEASGALRDIGMESNVNTNNLENVFDFIEDLREAIEELLEDDSEEAQQNMWLLASSIHRGIRDAREVRAAARVNNTNDLAKLFGSIKI